MSLKYLGETIDIHGGGQDLIFPHHENEITQSESFTGKSPFVKYWLHNGLLQLSGDKMSKSLGNLVTVKEVLRNFSPDALRFFILSSHYRSPLTYSEANIEAAEAGMQRLRQAVTNSGENNAGKTLLDSEPFRLRFIESMDDDFNTAQAIGVLFDLAREINRSREERIDIVKAQQTLIELATVLGFTLKKPTKPPIETEPLVKLLTSISNDLPQVKQWQAEFAVGKASISKVATEPLSEAESLLELLIQVRDKLRQTKHWQFADKVRNSLSDLGIILEDTPKGTTWRRSH